VRTKKKRISAERKREIYLLNQLWKKNNVARHQQHQKTYLRKLKEDPVRHRKKIEGILSWRKQNHKKHLEQRRRHYAKHRERLLAYEKAWKEVNGR
jgi:hypothetical protein